MMYRVEKPIRSLFVAGRFDDGQGRESKIANIIHRSMLIDSEMHNGGSFSKLERILGEVGNYDMIFWFADVPNDKEKLVRSIKKRNPAHILVTSKRNIGGNYSFHELIARSLEIKTNLFVEFSAKDDIYLGRVIDPLGNVFLDYTKYMNLVGKVIAKRAKELGKFKRVSSKEKEGIIHIPDDKEFFDLAKDYANVFHGIIHAATTTRFLGNLSFRCENGFPSYRQDDMIYVSRRNVDKRLIGREGVVAVSLDNRDVIEYFGENKPSVDTPIQIRLYNYYHNAKYMLHSHVYIKDAPFTENIVPCGAVEEADEIINVNPDKNAKNFFVNLKGHGSLAIMNDVKKMRNIPYIQRVLPEIHHDYAKEFLDE